MTAIDHTHDLAIRSWVESAQAPGADFPIQNLPFGLFRLAQHAPRVGVAIGDQIVDIVAAAEAELLAGDATIAATYCRTGRLNELMGAGPRVRIALRAALSELLRSDGPLAARAKATKGLLVPMADAELLVPATIGDYTDFYASIHHATNVGSMFRPDNPLLPNYKYVPIGYHGRASSIVASGTPVRRPLGQLRDDPAAPPVFAASRRLDYELELGIYIGRGNPIGVPVPIGRASEHLFGVCLVNDWSARDIQTWEYQPLGPFLAKNFATSVSPWVVTMDALAPFRIPATPRAADDPAPLPYLHAVADQREGGIDVRLEVLIRTKAMRDRGDAPFTVSRGSFRDMYWTIAQFVAHHTSNGCNLQPGDLLASGTISGPDKESRGCLLERTWRGTEPLALPGGETRKFLEDGDEVILRGWCERDGYARIGLGECRGTVMPAVSVDLRG